MTSLLSAQTLPIDVLKALMCRVVVKQPPFYTFLDIERRYNHLRQLFPLLSVCRSWRYAARSIFYRTAILKLPDGEEDIFDGRNIIHVHHVVAHQCQADLREIYLLVDVVNFNRDCDKGGLLATTVLNCGRLSAVRRVQLVFAVDRASSDSQAVDPRFDASPSMTRIQDNLVAFAASLREAAPNLCKVDIIVTSLYDATGSEKQVARRVLAGLDQLIMNCALPLAEPGQLPAAVTPPPPTLQTIVFSQYRGSDADNELLWRHSEMLEQLHICRTTARTAAKLVLDSGSSQHTHAYPRLKHLVIQRCDTGNGPPTVFPQNKCLFPQLETLVCKGQFPFAPLPALTGGTSRIRHLEVRLDAALLSAFTRNCPDASREFKLLYFASLSWNSASLEAVESPFDKVCHAVRICQHAQALRIHLREGFPLLGAVESNWFSKHLRLLQIPDPAITTPQAIQLFSACPSLEKAIISLKGVASDESNVPGLNYIHSKQKQCSDYQFSVHTLSIQGLAFETSIKAGEYIALLVYIVRSIRKVRLSHYGLVTRTRTILDDISSARNRPVYRDRPHLAETNFTIDRNI
ncbi:hypothetical protein LPJ63_005233 [Coemansia sp. RSA 2711]|nr:hypothetical protein LPJ63_005233 [Coemansia sp. RSA 2711]